MADDLVQTIDQNITELGSLVEGLRGAIGGLTFNALVTHVNALETNVNFLITSLLNAIQSSVTQSTYDATRAVQTTSQNVINQVGTTTQSVQTQLADLIASVLNSVRTTQETAAEDVRVVGDAVLEQSSIVLNSVADLQLELTDTSLDYLGQVTNLAGNTIRSLADSVSASLDAQAQASGSILSSIGDAFLSGISAVIDRVEALIAQGGGQIKSLIDTLTSGTNVQAETNAFGFNSIAQVLTNSPGTLIAGLEAVFGSPIVSIAEKLADLLPAFFGAEPERAYNALREMSESPIETHPETRRAYVRVRQAMAPYIEAAPFGGTLFAWIATALLLWAQTQDVAELESEEVVRELRRNTPRERLTPGDALEAYKRGLIDDESLKAEMLSHGYNDIRQGILTLMQERLPEPERLLQWFYRRFIDEDQLRQGLAVLGFSPDSAENIRQAGELIPPVGDIITMAVREVFSPDVAQTFGQYEDLPEDFIEHAATQGLTREWAERYWAAHWGLPSATQGFEMFHRGIIDDEQLTLLLRSLDIMPFWRDRLIQMAYTPFTRVDLRRMYDLGVLGREDVIRGYMDIGYERSKAELLTDFAESLQDDRALNEETELKTATRSTILKGYSRGILSRDAAFDLLLEADYTDDAASLFLTLEDLEAEYKQRDSVVDTLEVQFKAGVISFEQAQDRLNAAGLETAERDQALAKLIREQARQVRQPTRADLDRFVKANIITQEEYISEMENAGYTRKWAVKYLQVALGQEPDIR